VVHYATVVLFDGGETEEGESGGKWDGILRKVGVLLLRTTCRIRVSQAQKRPECEGSGCEGHKILSAGVLLDQPLEV
jgi:hypothetical protein